MLWPAASNPLEEADAAAPDHLAGRAADLAAGVERAVRRRDHGRAQPLVAGRRGRGHRRRGGHGRARPVPTANNIASRIRIPTTTTDRRRPVFPYPADCDHAHAPAAGRHPQHRDHRPRRPRQDDAGRRAAPAVGHLRRPRRAGRPGDGRRPGARAGHHDPGQERRLPLRGHEDQHHRHARPRRLRRRGGARPDDGRRRAAAGRRVRGAAAADPVRAAQGAGRPAAGDPGGQQGRPAGRPDRRGGGRGLRPVLRPRRRPRTRSTSRSSTPTPARAWPRSPTASRARI